mmetsp:Transcript_3998/g.12189  ORF Transcript_3998/g.12189 Transcript_3998/m.12189 type:complete len:101 (+) Transcript_3998:382-684(+)
MQRTQWIAMSGSLISLASEYQRSRNAADMNSRMPDTGADRMLGKVHVTGVAWGRLGVLQYVFQLWGGLGRESRITHGRVGQLLTETVLLQVGEGDGVGLH